MSTLRQGRGRPRWKAGGATVCVLVAVLSGCSEVDDRTSRESAPFLRDARALVRALETRDRDAIPGLADPWFSRPGAILGGLERLSEGSLDETTVTALANFVGLACRSYLEAPRFAGLELAEREEFLARVRRAIYDFPPREGRHLLETMHRSGGLGPEHHEELVGWAELPGLLGTALNVLSVTPSNELQRRRAARRLFPVYLLDEAELDPLARDQALTLFLVGAHPESLALLERRFEEVGGDELWRRALTRRALVHPDSEAVLAVLERAWSGRTAPSIGFGIRLSPDLAEHHVAVAVPRLAEVVEVEEVAFRSLLLEIACLDPAFTEWFAANGPRCDERAFAIARLKELPPDRHDPDDRLRVAREVLLGAEPLVIDSGYPALVGAVLDLVEDLEGAREPEFAALVVDAVERTPRARERYADRTGAWLARAKPAAEVSTERGDR